MDYLPLGSRRPKYQPQSATLEKAARHNNTVQVTLTNTFFFFLALVTEYIAFFFVISKCCFKVRAL